MSTSGRAARTRAALLSVDADHRELWCAYLDCGGGAGYLEFEAYLYGALTLSPMEELALQQTAWDRPIRNSATMIAQPMAVASAATTPGAERRFLWGSGERG